MVVDMNYKPGLVYRPVFAKASKWYHKAADAGDRESMYLDFLMEQVPDQDCPYSHTECEFDNICEKELLPLQNYPQGCGSEMGQTTGLLEF